jgi:hypothetical protein
MISTPVFRRAPPSAWQPVSKTRWVCEGGVFRVDVHPSGGLTIKLAMAFILAAV